MKIPSVDHRSWITVDARADGSGYVGCAIEAHVELGHGTFHARNEDAHISNISAFATQLDAFITNRRGVPNLVGSHDTFIRISGTATRVFVDFQIGYALGDTPAKTYRLSGSFAFDQTALSKIVEDLREMEKAYLPQPSPSELA